MRWCALIQVKTDEESPSRHFNVKGSLSSPDTRAGRTIVVAPGLRAPRSDSSRLGCSVEPVAGRTLPGLSTY